MKYIPHSQIENLSPVWRWASILLAPNGSSIPNVRGWRYGRLTNDDQPLNSRESPFVVVEFDIFPNAPWDPLKENVPIDINSMESIANVRVYFIILYCEILMVIKFD